MNILHLDSSILGAFSASRDLSAAILDRLVALNPDAKVTYCDLDAQPPLHLSSAHIAVFQGAPVDDAALGADLGTGGAYIEELFAADIIVIGAPMYNFTISTQLKSWIDRVVVSGKTFQYGANGPESLLPSGKKVFLASTRGGAYGEGSPAASLEHHESYLRGVLGFIGLTDVTVVRAEGLAMGDDAKAASIAQAKDQIAVLA
ncbi:FMN-dependent NADH-azoreductase [Agrobacterium rhizogenes]|nr:FMN-dependent NADH-azoreductase [Rhizobium rhizogenes]NTJ79417.1 FMN-dependent NADH-azoreductase [Rhizobium rhizogenes]